jgi:hypothetical protein
MARLFNPDIATLGTDPANQQLVQQGLAQLQDRYDKAKELEFNARLQAGESFLNADDLERFNQDVDNKIKESYKNFDGKIGFGANQLKQSALNIMQHPAKKLADKQKRYYEDVLKHEAAGNIVLNKKDILAPIFDQEGKVRDIGELQVLSPDQVMKSSEVLAKSLLNSRDTKVKNIGNGYVSMYKMDDNERNNLLNSEDGIALINQSIQSLGYDPKQLAETNPTAYKQIFEKAKIGLSAGLMEDEKIQQDITGNMRLQFSLQEQHAKNEAIRKAKEDAAVGGLPFFESSNWGTQDSKMRPKSEFIPKDFNEAKKILSSTSADPGKAAEIKRYTDEAKLVLADKENMSLEELNRKLEPAPQSLAVGNTELDKITKNLSNIKFDTNKKFISTEANEYPNVVGIMANQPLPLALVTIGGKLLANKVLKDGKYEYTDEVSKQLVESGLYKEEGEFSQNLTPGSIPTLTTKLVPNPDKVTKAQHQALMAGIKRNSEFKDNEFNKKLAETYTKLVSVSQMEERTYEPEYEHIDELKTVISNLKLSAKEVAKAANMDDQELAEEVFTDLGNISIKAPLKGENATITGISDKDKKAVTINLDPTTPKGRDLIRNLATYTNDPGFFADATLNYHRLPDSGITSEDILKRQKLSSGVKKSKGLFMKQTADDRYYLVNKTKDGEDPWSFDDSGEPHYFNTAREAANTLLAMEGIPSFDEELLYSNMDKGSEKEQKQRAQAYNITRATRDRLARTYANFLRSTLK